MTVDFSLGFSVRFRRDDDGHFLLLDCFDDFVCVVALVGDEVFALRSLDELGGFRDIMNVSAGEMYVEWITEPVHKSVDLGSKTPSRAPNTLNVGPPFPPAESWWALM